MYIPAPFRETDDVSLRGHIRAHPFAALCAVIDAAPVVAHIPLLLHERDERQCLIGHVARVGPLAAADGAAAVAIFSGPEGYVTPSWYASKREHGRVVPTWDYVAVHASGRLRVHQDPGRLLDELHELTDRMEVDAERPWSVDDAPSDYIEQHVRAIVGIELVVERLEGQVKLSQNRSTQDVDGVVTGLRERARDGDLPLATQVERAVRDGRPA